MKDAFAKALGERFKHGFKTDQPMDKETSIGVGGIAKYHLLVKSVEDLADAVRLARDHKIKWTVIGEASNLIISDSGYDGLIVRNQIEKFERKDESLTVKVGAGNNLFELIFKLDSLGLAGMEKMAGIPGTVGGAVFGCAGAYGQEIRDTVVKVGFFDGSGYRTFEKGECGFGYRNSVFKKRRNWLITEVTLRLTRGDPTGLLKTSRDIIRLRERKYRPGLKCPGSFFKNIKLDELSAKQAEGLLKRAGEDAVVYGKLPAGYLLDKVGAKGLKAGKIRVARHHGNLIYNSGGGKAADVVKMAQKLKALVKKRFGVTIEEEVQYLE